MSCGRDIFTLKNQLFVWDLKKTNKIFNNIEIKPSNQESFKRENYLTHLAKILDLFKLLKLNTFVVTLDY